ncbi:MAG: TolC family protein [Gammaproteobacteria bacterium]
MNKWPKLGFGLLCWLFSTAAAATDQAIPLTLVDAVNTALSRRPELMISKARLAGAGAKVSEMRGAFLPSLDLYSDVRKTTNYDSFSGVNISAIIFGQPVNATVTNTIPVYQVTSGVELSLNLYAGGLNFAHLAEASAEERANQAQDNIARREVILDVATAYWDLKRAQMEQGLAAEALALARDDERIASAQWKEGRLSELARDTGTLKALEAEARLTGANSIIKEKWQRYLLALGYHPQTDRIDPMALPIDDSAAMDLDRLLLRYVNTPQPNVAKANAEADGASARVDAQRAEFSPRVDFYLAFNQVGRDNDQLNHTFSNLSRQNSFVGVRLQWNLFTGQQSTYRQKRALEELYVARMRVDQERANQLKTWYEQQSHMEVLPAEVALAEKHRDIAKLELRIARVQMNTQQISEQEYRSREFAAKEADVRVTLSKIDLALARLSLAVTRPDSM